MKILVSGFLSLFCIGCSSTLQRSIAAPENPSSHQSSNPVVTVLESTRKTERQVELKMKHSKGEQVLVSKRLLRKLLLEQHLSEYQCSRVSGQLEALKQVDREDIHDNTGGLVR